MTLDEFVSTWAETGELTTGQRARMRADLEDVRRALAVECAVAILVEDGSTVSESKHMVGRLMRGEAEPFYTVELAVCAVLRNGGAL